MNNTFNLVEFIKLVLRWRKAVMIVCAIATVGAIVISDPHIMKPYYKSQAIFYPVNPNLSSAQNMYGTSSEQPFYGTNEDVDKMMSVTTSAPLKLYLVQKFKLFQHYDIDSASSSIPMTKVIKELDDNFSAIVNSRSAIEVTVFDHDKQFAADMANEIVKWVNEQSTQLLNANKTQILSLYETKVKEKEKQVNMLNDSLINMKDRYHFSSNIGGLQAMTNAPGGNSRDYQIAMQSIKLLEEKSRAALKDLNTSLGAYEQYKSSISNSVPSIFLMERATPAEKKAKPVRWQIAVGAMLLSFFLTVLIAFAVESFAKLRNAVRQS